MAAVSASAGASGAMFPFNLEVDGPQPQSRLSIFFRIIFAIPQLIGTYFISALLSIVGLIGWLVILFTGKYPGGMMSFSTGGLRWLVRTYAYMALLTGQYPPFSLEDDSKYPVRFLGQGQTDGRNRLTCFFRLLMVIPHVIVLYILGAIAYIAVVIAWFAALITGSVPSGLHTFIAGVLRWGSRVYAYYYLLTDEYPPFSMS